MSKHTVFNSLDNLQMKSILIDGFHNIVVIDRDIPLEKPLRQSIMQGRPSVTVETAMITNKPVLHWFFFTTLLLKTVPQ